MNTYCIIIIIIIVITYVFIDYYNNSLSITTKANKPNKGEHQSINKIFTPPFSEYKMVYFNKYCKRAKLHSK